MGFFFPASSKQGRKLINVRGRYTSRYQPHQGEKQDAKKFKEFNSCGRMTLGRTK